MSGCELHATSVVHRPGSPSTRDVTISKVNLGVNDVVPLNWVGTAIDVSWGTTAALNLSRVTYVGNRGDLAKPIVPSTAATRAGWRLKYVPGILLDNIVTFDKLS